MAHATTDKTQAARPSGVARLFDRSADGSSAETRMALAMRRQRVQIPAMTRSPAPRRSGSSLWLGLVALAVVVLLVAPQAIAAGIGQVMAEALVAALTALAAIFGPLAGGG